MNKKSIFSILLLFIIIASANCAFAETSDNTPINSTNDSPILVENANEYNIHVGSNNSDIQNTINKMHDGDTLNFENGTYNNIIIYIDKNITINGNGATLIGLSTAGDNKCNIPDIVKNTTQTGGWAVGNLATVYVLGTTGTTINNLHIVGINKEYTTAVLYSKSANNLLIKDCNIDGASWGIYLQLNKNATVENNLINNQITTGILNFGSGNSKIRNNIVKNVTNHGIDVRHGSGPNVSVYNNTITGAKEGIYLMHSAGHTVYNNTIINSVISGITCYGSGEILIENNTISGSRMGILLGSGFYNITIGENKFNLTRLLYPPSFPYYVTVVDSDYQSAKDDMGTFSDRSAYDIAYTNKTITGSAEPIIIDFESRTKGTGITYNVPAGASSTEIQQIIGNLKDGDTLIFEENAVYKDISIYIEKNVKIIGNNATLIGMSSYGVNNSNIPEKIRKTSAEGGYAIGNLATLYILNNTGASVTNLNIKAINNEYNTAALYTYKVNNLTVYKNNIIGGSWGIYTNMCPNYVTAYNNVQDQATTGILSFGSSKGIILNNVVTNAVNHGIDVRHGSGPNVTVQGNIVTGAKEGIYLMHSAGHTVVNNTVIDSKISGITAYGSGELKIYNNTITGSRMGFLLGGGFYNVTIGNNSYGLDFLPYPPTFVYYLGIADSGYQSPTDVKGTYSDMMYSIISKDLVKYYKNESQFKATFVDTTGKPLSNTNVTFIIDNIPYTRTTDANGTATMIINLRPGEYEITSVNPLNGETTTNTITVLPTVTGDDLTKYYLGKEMYNATFLDEQGNPLKNTEVSFNIDGVFYKRTTDEDGVAFLKINLRPNTFIITAINPINGEMHSNNITIVSTVSGNDLVKYFRNDSQYSAKFVDSEGNPLANTKVKFNIDGVFYERSTDENGIATMNINLREGKFIITAINPVTGQMYSNNITVLPTLEAEDLEMHQDDGSAFEIKAVDGQGKAIANKNITFNIDGVFYHRTTDENGIAKLNINLRAGDFIITSTDGSFTTSNKIKILP